MKRSIHWILIITLLVSFFPLPVFAAEDTSVESEKTSTQVVEDEQPSQPVDDAPPPAELADSPAAEQQDVPIDNTPNMANSSASSIPTPQITNHSQAVALSGPETTPGSIVTSFNVSTTIEYMEIYNQSDKPVDMTAMRFRASTPNGEMCELISNQSGWLLPDEYLSLSSPTALKPMAHTFSSDCIFEANITRLEVYYHDSRIQLIDEIVMNGATLMRHKNNVQSGSCEHKIPPTTMKQTGSSADYVACSSAMTLHEGHLYVPPADSGLKIVELLPNARDCLPSELGLDCSDYIKVKNNSEQDINLAEFRLRSGAKYTNATISTSFNWHQPTLHPDRDEYMLPAGQYFLLRLRNDSQVLSLSNSNGAVWIEDYYGVQAYDEVSYTDMDLAAASGKSWAYDLATSTWKFGIPSPAGDNKYPVEEPGKGGGSSTSDLKPCRDDQYRSEETNRCRNISSTSGLAACKEGQYRSEETNRCRSIASAAASVLKPCADDQFRNPATNRCKSIASADDMADCGEGRERNPATNRCRNVVQSDVPAAAFAVEPIKDSATAFVGWWALGGVAAFGLGYAGWEWRREVLSSLQKALAFLRIKS